MKVYIIFGDSPRSDGKNIEGIYFSQEKAKEYIKDLECCYFREIKYSLEEFETNDELSVTSQGMTREEAIEVLKDLWRYEHSGFSEKDIREAIDIAIKALEHPEKNVIEVVPCGNSISKQAALDCLTATGLKKFDFILDARDKIKNLPPVTPQPKMGRWIEDLSDYDDKYPKHVQALWKCVECKQKQLRKSNYCPNCGSYNGGGNNGNE